MGCASLSACILKYLYVSLLLSLLTQQDQASDINSSQNSLNEMEMDDDGNPRHQQPLPLSLHQQQLLRRLEMSENQMQSPTDETDDGTIDNDRVEYAVLLPDSFAVLDSTFDQHSL